LVFAVYQGAVQFSWFKQRSTAQMKELVAAPALKLVSKALLQE
jgi:hypothetical protein